MYNKIKYKKVLISILIVLSCFSIQGIKADTDPQQKYSEIEDLNEMVTAYHFTINDIFNEKVKLILDDKGTQEVPNDGDCEGDEKNVSTYCVAVLVVKEFEAFQKELLTRSDDIDLGFTQDTDNPYDYSIEEITGVAQQQQDFIADTLVQSEQAMDLSLETYDQFRVAYPMHLYYMQVIDELETYNDEMAQIRAYSEYWPGKFIDATTTDCT